MYADLTPIYNETFEGATLHLDGHDWRNCTFRSCTLIYSGGPLQFRDNRLFACRHQLGDAASRTLAFLTMIYHQGAKELVEHTFSNIRRGNHPNPPDAAD